MAVISRVSPPYLSLSLCIQLHSLPITSMMIINLIGKPITIALACVTAYFRTGASIPGFR